jgi:adenylate kinase
MSEDCVLAVSGTPGVGKTQLCAWLIERGWSLLTVEELAEKHGCLGQVDADDGAAPVDIHRLAEEWEVPEQGRWVVDGHLAHFLDVDGIVLLRCRPNLLQVRLENRGYADAKIKANVEWEQTSGHWAELLEFGIDISLLELDSSEMNTDTLGNHLLDWVEDGLPSEPLEESAVSALDWLSES